MQSFRNDSLESTRNSLANVMGMGMMMEMEMEMVIVMVIVMYDNGDADQ